MVISKLEQCILKTMNNFEVDKVTVSGEEFIKSINQLTETDEIFRIREAVYYIDSMIERGLIDKNAEYYVNNDVISMKYLNAAVEIFPSKISVSPLGQKMILHKRIVDIPIDKSKIHKFFSYLFTYVLGMITMFAIFEIINWRY